MGQSRGTLSVGHNDEHGKLGENIIKQQTIIGITD